LDQRGATEAEVLATVTGGEQFTAKFGRTGFRRNLPFQKQWRGRFYATKQVTAFAVPEEDGWLCDHCDCQILLALMKLTYDSRRNIG
jgi:hypothetical protein